MLNENIYIFYFFLFQTATATSPVTQEQDTVADACLTNVVSNRVYLLRPNVLISHTFFNRMWNTRLDYLEKKGFLYIVCVI